MKMLRFLLAIAAVSTAIPVAVARADCTTPEGRATVRFKYSAAMAAWSEGKPDAYAAAQDQMHTDRTVAQRAGDEKLCAFWTKYIKMSHQ